MDLSALTDAELDTLKSALVSSISGIATSQSYKIGDRSLTRMSPSECRIWLDAVSSEIRLRADSTAGVIYVELEDPGA